MLECRPQFIGVIRLRLKKHDCAVRLHARCRHPQSRRAVHFGEHDPRTVRDTGVLADELLDMGCIALCRQWPDDAMPLQRFSNELRVVFSKESPVFDLGLSSSSFV